jgi:hypothetical protein
LPQTTFHQECQQEVQENYDLNSVLYFQNAVLNSYSREKENKYPPVQLKVVTFSAVTTLQPFLLGASAITSIEVTFIARRKLP